MKISTIADAIEEEAEISIEGNCFFSSLTTLLCNVFSVILLS